MKRYGFLMVALLSLNACTNLPPAIENAPAVDISYPQARSSGGRYKNQPVRWGGVVIDVQNEPQYSLVQVLAYPLSSDGRPKLDKVPEGRFLVKSGEFLDPAIYSKDTELTVAGILTGAEERKVGNKTVQMPEVSAQVIYRWPKYERSYYGYPGYGYYGPYPRYRFGYYPFYPNYYWGWPYW